MFENNIILFDGQNWESLLPITYTRAIADIRIGITTIKEKWELFSSDVSIQAKDYLNKKYKSNISSDNIFINGGLLPTDLLVLAIGNLEQGQALFQQGNLLAFRNSDFKGENDIFANQVEFTEEVFQVNFPWDIFSMNEKALLLDFFRITNGKKSQAISETNRVINPENIFIEEGASVEFATINASAGPVYIGADAEIMEGAMVRGPLALCEHSTIKMGAKIYEATTIGPWSKVAGEIQNVVITGYSNKGHDGYLGNAVLGEWCNIGADSNSSNLKNNYEKIKVWNYSQERFLNTGLQFCGLIMGDHSKCGINTMFNTGTVVGVSANIFGAGFPRNFVPSFSWGGAGGFTTYQIKKALDTAKIVFGRRNLELSEQDISILEHIFEQTKKYRKD